MSDELTVGNITFEEWQEPIDFVQKHERLPINLQVVKTCKYLLPCGKCDKTDQMCSQYDWVQMKT